MRDFQRNESYKRCKTVGGWNEDQTIKEKVMLCELGDVV